MKRFFLSVVIVFSLSFIPVLSNSEDDRCCKKDRESTLTYDPGPPYKEESVYMGRVADFGSLNDGWDNRNGDDTIIIIRKGRNFNNSRRLIH